MEIREDGESAGNAADGVFRDVLQMSQTILGIDLGSYSIKLLRVARHVQDIEVLDFIEEPLSPHSRLTHEEQVRVALEKVLANSSLKADVVCASFPGYYLSSRIVEFPFSSSKKISQVVDFEIEGQIPFSIEDILSDYCILEQGFNQSRALCVYTQEELFKKYQDSLSSLGLDAKYFGADVTDLPAIAHVAMVPSEGYYALCDIGHNKTNLVIMKGKDLKYARTIGMGGHHFTRAIQRIFNLNFEKAEAIKLARGKLFIRMDESDQISRILNRTAVELASAIRQTFLGARHYYDDLNIQGIYCCGGGCKLIGMADFLSYYLKMNVFELDVLSYVNHQFSDPEEMNKIIPQVLSTTLRPIHSNRVPRINFRKGPYAFKQDIQFITSEMKAIVGFLVVLMVLGLFYYFYASHAYLKKEAAVSDRVAAVVKSQFPELESGSKGKKISTTAYLKSAQKKLAEFQSKFASQEGGVANVVQAMELISKALPPKSDVNFAVTEFQFTENFVTLKSVTNDTLTVEKIVEALQKTQNFAKVEATDAQPKANNQWYFNLNIDLKKPEATD